MHDHCTQDIRHACGSADHNDIMKRQDASLGNSVARQKVRFQQDENRLVRWKGFDDRFVDAGIRTGVRGTYPSNLTDDYDPSYFLSMRSRVAARNTVRSHSHASDARNNTSPLYPVREDWCTELLLARGSRISGTVFEGEDTKSGTQTAISALRKYFQAPHKSYAGAPDSYPACVTRSGTKPPVVCQAKGSAR